jgi:regulator of protease activity HflC (stomatin/prohibitin superfamily)
MFYIILGVIVLAFILVIKLSIEIVPQSRSYVIERLGGYHTTFDVGIHFKLPLLDKVVKNWNFKYITNKGEKGVNQLYQDKGVSLKELFVDYPPQPVITKDNVTLQVDTVVYFMVSDPKLYTYGADNPISAMEYLTVTTLRNVIGEIELDETLTSRDIINTKLRSILDEATDAWGIKVNRVEVKNIEPPKSVLDAMEQQMKAEREKRAVILTAEGEKQSEILKAEGAKQSQILTAEAAKQAKILDAEGEKEASIQKADGEAQAILATQKAIANGLVMVKQAIGEEGAIKLQSFDALVKVADGKATKIIIPSELQNISSLISGIKESIN